MKQSVKKASTRGFTLIEILIVIGIIAILAAVVLIAVNPARQFSKANDAQRSSNLNAIINAVGQYVVDNKGDISGLDITGTAQDISNGGADLCSDLTPLYLSALPADPTKTDQSIDSTECGTYSLGYNISITGGRVTITAPNTEIGSDITITR